MADIPIASFPLPDGAYCPLVQADGSALIIGFGRKLPTDEPASRANDWRVSVGLTEVSNRYSDRTSLQELPQLIWSVFDAVNTAPLNPNIGEESDGQSDRGVGRSFGSVSGFLSSLRKCCGLSNLVSPSFPRLVNEIARGSPQEPRSYAENDSERSDYGVSIHGDEHPRALKDDRYTEIGQTFWELLFGALVIGLAYTFLIGCGRSKNRDKRSAGNQPER